MTRKFDVNTLFRCPLNILLGKRHLEKLFKTLAGDIACGFDKYGYIYFNGEDMGLLFATFPYELPINGYILCGPCKVAEEALKNTEIYQY